MASAFGRVQTRAGSASLSAFAIGALLFLYVPLLVLIVFSFNDNRSLSLPLRSFTLMWHYACLNNSDMLKAIRNRLYVASVATAITVVIGAMVALALDRDGFPGKPTFVG